MDDYLLELNQKEVGKTYHRLTILEIDRGWTNGDKPKSKIVAICKCSCGNIKYIELNSILRGATKSCGCLNRSQDGGTYTRIYYIWNTRKVDTPNFSAEWETFSNFKDWCEQNQFEEKDTVLSIDTSKPFGPDNAVVTKRGGRTANEDSLYIFTSPEGEDHVVFDLFDFCYEQELNPYMAQRAISGYEQFIRTGNKNHSTHLGWTIRRRKINEDLPEVTYEDTLYYPYTDLF